jgi:hypothetical protein
MVRGGMAEWGPGKETVVLLADGNGTPLSEPKTFCFVPNGLKCIPKPKAEQTEELRQAIRKLTPRLKTEPLRPGARVVQTYNPKPIDPPARPTQDRDVDRLSSIRNVSALLRGSAIDVAEEFATMMLDRYRAALAEAPRQRRINVARSVLLALGLKPVDVAIDRSKPIVDTDEG